MNTLSPIGYEGYIKGKAETEQKQEIKPVSRLSRVSAVKSVQGTGSQSNLEVDWKTKVQETLNTLKNTYKEVNIVTNTLFGSQAIQQYAAKAGEGAYLVVSENFLNRMAQGASAFENGKELLEMVLQQLSKGNTNGAGIGAYLDENSVRYWFAVPEKEIPTVPQTENKPKTLFDWMQEAKEKAEKLKSKFKVSSSIYSTPMQIYSKLSRASSVQQVKNVSYTAGHKIYQLKVALSQADSKDRDKIRAVLGQLQRAVVKARGKVRNLEEENRMKMRMRKAEKQDQMKKAQQISYLLKKKQAARRSREHALVNGSAVWSYYMAEMERQKMLKEYERPTAAPVDTVGGLSASAAVPAASSASGGTGFSASAVTVSASVPISIA